MSTPTRGRRVMPRAYPAPARASSSHLPLSPSRTHVAGFRESAPADVLLDYRWLALCLCLSLAPLLASGQQTRGTSAIGLRYMPVVNGFGEDFGWQRNTDLTFRYAFDDRWSAELTAGYWQRDAAIRFGTALPIDTRTRRFRGSVTLQREWTLARPNLRVYAGAGVGFSSYSVEDLARGEPVPSGRRRAEVTFHGAAGFRYEFDRVPLELDFGIRPGYGGRGIGLDLAPSVGLRYRFGGRK